MNFSINTGMKNKISIGMTAYNSAGFISESIESLLAQTFHDFTLIISDDASTDDTPNVCKAWAKIDSRILYFRQKYNLGPRANFEFVFNQGKAEFFMWASHDDVWSDNFLQNCVDELITKPEVGFVITRWIMESRNYPFIRRCFLPSMKFIADPDPIKRLMSFTALPFSSFKDNLTYGVWRHNILERVINDTKNTKYFSIGCAANEYALLISSGSYIDNAHLRKRYKRFPPGSIFEIFVVLLCALTGRHQKKYLYPSYSSGDFIDDLEYVFKVAGLDNSNIEKALHLNRQHLGVNT